MPSMIELIRASAVPSNLMQSAARGALSLPPQEMIEILVYLATQNRVFGEQASLTLAGWDENSSLAAASDPHTSKAVLDYLIDPANLRPSLLPALLENPSVEEERIALLAAAATREQTEALLRSPRVGRSQAALTALSSNPNVSGIQSAGIEEKLSAWRQEPIEEASPSIPASDSPPSDEECVSSRIEAVSVPLPDGDIDAEFAAYLAAHSNEIIAEAGKPYQLIGGNDEELMATSGEIHDSDKLVATEAAASSGTAAAAKPALAKKSFLGAGHEKGSALKKIAVLDIKGRIQLAMKGTKEERSLLIRDGTKIVALAVLESPKITDGEVEKFATQKNVLEAVLRAIPMKRRFAKNYAVVRNLIFNPRTPLDVSLGMMKHLQVQDLKHLSGNKEVSDTIRKLGLKMFRQKLDTNKKKSD